MLQISQRLRGVKEDGEAIEEDGFMPKLKKAFGDVGVEIEDQNGELRSTFDILNDLAGVWDTLSSKQRQYLGEKAAGNRQVKVLNAIMANWDVVEDTIEKANEATGEATKGNEKYLDSIEGRITQFKSAFSDLARTTIDSDFVKGIVGFGTGVLNVTKDLGGLVPVLTTISGIIITLKGVKIAQGLKSIGTAIAGLMSGLSGAGGLVGILTSLPGAIGAIVAVIGVVAAVTSAINSAKKDITEVASEKRQGYEDQKAKVEGLNEELKNTQSLMSDLSKETLTVVEQDEYNRLKETNDQLERQIALEKTRLKITQREARELTAQEVKQYNESTDSGNFWFSHDNQVSRGLLDTLGTKWFDNNLKREHILFGTSPEETKLMKETGAAYVPSVEELVQAHSEALILEKQNLIKANEEYYREIAKATDSEGNVRPEALDYIKTLEETKKQAESYVNESETFLNDYLSYLEEKTTGISKVENAAPGSLDAYYNSIIEERERIADVLLTSSAMDMSKGDQSKLILAKYTELAEQVKERVKEAGEITAEELGSDAFKELSSEYEKYGWTVEDVARHLTEQFKTQIEETNGVNSILDELITNNYLASDSYKALSTAMTEQQKAGTISMETYQKLMSDTNFASYLSHTSDALKLTANGLALNTDAMYEYIASQQEGERIRALDSLKKNIDLLNETKAAMEGLSGKELAEKMDQSNALQNEITALQAYINELNAATGALAKYKAAKQTQNQDAMFNEGENAYKDIQEGLKSGKVGTDDFKNAVGFVLGENWQEELDRFDGSVDKAYKEASKLGKRYFGQKDERAGMRNFMQDLEDEGFADYDSKTGTFALKEKADGTLYSIEELSKAIGVSADAADSLFGLMESYGYNVEYEPMITEDDQKAIDEYNKKLEVQKQEVDNLKGSQKEANDALEEAKEAYDIDPSEANKKVMDSAQEQADLAGKAVEQAEEKLSQLEEGTEVKVETMSIQEALTLFQELQGYIDAGLPIDISVGGDYDTLKKFLEDLGVIPPANVTLNADGDAEEKVEGINKETDKFKQGATGTLDANGNAEETLTSVNNDKDLFAEGADSALNVTGNAQSDLQTIKSDVENIEGEHEIKFNVDYNDPLNYKKGSQKYAEDALSGGSGVDLDSIGDQFTLYISALRKNVEAALGDMSWAKKWMQNIQQKGGNVDLLNRPVIPASKLTDMGYDAGEDGIATLFSHSTNIGENGEIGVVLTPILPDGDVLEPSTIDSVLENLFVGSDGKIQLPEGDWGFNLSDILVSSLDLSQMPTEMRGPYMEAFSEALHQVQEAFYSGGESIDVPLTVEEDSGKNIHDQVQEQLDTQSPVEEQVVQQSQPAQPATPVNETKFELDLGNTDAVQDQVGQIAQMSDELAGMASEAGASTGSINALNDACAELITATSDLGSIDMGDPASVEAAASSISTAASNFNEAYNKLSAEIDAMQTVNVGADTSSAERSIDALSNKTVTITVQAETSGIPPYAKGTHNAPGGMSLVDEKGAELIEHTRQGTYELGTNNGPRFTNLEKGDVVHTASETKKILSRMSAIGGFFRDGLNQAKSIIGEAFSGGGRKASGQSSAGKSSSSTKKKSSSKKSSKKSSSKSSKVNMKKLQAWAEKLFDWAEIRLERLQTITDEWIYKAGQAIGYAAQNTQLANAMKSVENQIKDTTAAYNLYIAQADKVAKKTKLSADIINRIQNGTIEISSYDKNTQEKIKMYQTWWNFFMPL